MLLLYHSPQSRSSRFIWLLEELRSEYDIIYCDIPRRSGQGAPDRRNPHPEKRVPALLHDRVLVTEQSAIALYLTDLIPDGGFGEPIGSPLRANYLSWLAYYAGEIDVLYKVKVTYGDRLDPATERDQRRIVERVAAALDRGPFLLGAKPTAADILVSGPFEWDPGLAMANTAILDWVTRLRTRPAAAVAAAKDAQPTSAE